MVLDEGFTNPFLLKKLQHYSVMYVLSVIVIAGAHVSIVKAIVRTSSRQSVSVFLLQDWPLAVKLLVPFAVIVYYISPVVLIVICHVGAAILMHVEGWTFIRSFDYNWCNLLGIGPFTHLTPTSASGMICDIILSTFNLLFFNAIVGLVAATAVVNKVQDLLPVHRWGILAALLLCSISLQLLALFCGGFLALMESWSFGTGYLYMVGLICGLQDPLVANSPDTPLGDAFQSFCVMIQVCVSGAIVGILGNHPKMLALVSWLEGLGSSSGVGASESSDQTIHGASDLKDATAVPLENVPNEHQSAGEIQNQIQEMKQQHEDELQQIDERYQARLQELEKQHIASIDHLQNEHAQQLKEHLESIDSLKRSLVDARTTQIDAGNEQMHVGLKETEAKSQTCLETTASNDCADSKELALLREEMQELRGKLQKTEEQLRDSNDKLQVLSSEALPPTSETLHVQFSLQQNRGNPAIHDTVSNLDAAHLQQMQQGLVAQREADGGVAAHDGTDGGVTAWQRRVGQVAAQRGEDRIACFSCLSRQ